MFRIKSGPYGARLSPLAAIAAMFIVVKEVMDYHGLDYEMSSAMEGEHMPGSLHFVGMAYDWTVREEITELIGNDISRRVKENLGDDFDIIWKQSSRRLHIEFQPKRSFGRLG